MSFNKEFWESKYNHQQTGWDIGYPATPLVEYIDQLTDKDLKILIPGCGRAYELEYLWKNGFKNVFGLDLAPSAAKEFLKRVPDFPVNQFFTDSFWDLSQKFDLIIEQTFFCAISPLSREDYISKMAEITNPSGKVVGLLFDFPLTEEGPPFGGSLEEYKKRFEEHFTFYIEKSHNSIKPRQGKEYFFIAKKQD